MFNNLKKISLISIVLVLLAISFYSILYKIVYDMKNHKVELTISYKDVHDLHLATGIMPQDILSDFSKIGITSIILNEDNIADYINSGKLTLLSGLDILNDNRIHSRSYSLIFSRLPANFQIKPEYSYIVIDESYLFDSVKQNLLLKLGASRVKDLGWNIIEVISSKEDLLKTSINFNPTKLQIINKAGLGIIPLFLDNKDYTETQISSKFNEISNYEVFTIGFDGEQTLQGKDNLNITALKINDSNINYISQEFYSQKDFQKLALISPQNGIKLHLLPAAKYNPQINAQRAVRSVIERNVRIIQIKPYTLNLGNDLYQKNLSYIEGIQKALQDKRFQIEKITDYKPFIAPSSYLISYLAANALLFIIIITFLNTLHKNKHPYFNSIVIISYSAFEVLMYILLGKYFISEINALITAIITPVLCFIIIKDNLDKGIKDLFTILIYLFSFSLTAAIIINTFLLDNLYILSILKFRGVKIASILPVILLFIYFFVEPRRLLYLNYLIKRYLQKHLNIKYVLLSLIILIFVFFYIMRTGNYGMLIFGNFELTIRSILENTFITRPRTKEILFAYPLLYLAIFYWKKENVPENVKLMLLTFSSITSISIINTFCHVHAPFILTLYRTLVGMGIGIGIGFLLKHLIDKYFLISNKINKKFQQWLN